MGRLVKSWYLVALTLPIMLVSACSLQPRGAKAAGTSKGVMSPPAKSAISNREAPTYLLGYGDVIEVKFFKNQEYNDTVAVRPDGRISLQRVGDIYVKGMSTTELDDIITKTYAEILRDPEVTVIVREFGGQEFYVMGEVAKPGKYEVGKGMTLLRALATAGGPTDSGKLNSVMLLRADDYGRAEATRVNLDMSAVADNVARDIPLQAYDIVYVPRTFVADVNAWLSQVYDVILPPLDVWTRYKYWYGRN